jgi:hypothetical protein
VVHRRIGGLRGVGTLGIAAFKVLYAYMRCPFPEVERVIVAQVSNHAPAMRACAAP